jgi:AcrR family transcriptional regulator
MASEKQAESFVERLAALAAAKDVKKGERTRRQLKLAAARCLESTSLPLLGMDQVASEAGVSRPTIYLYFSSIDELVGEVLNDFRQMTLDTLAEPRRGETLADSIFRTHYAYVLHYARNAALMERVRELMSSSPELVKDRQRINSQWTRRVLSKVLSAGRENIDKEALHLRIYCLGSMVDDVLREAYVVGNPAFDLASKDAEGFAKELTAIWTRVLLPLQSGD